MSLPHISSVLTKIMTGRAALSVTPQEVQAVERLTRHVEMLGSLARKIADDNASLEDVLSHVAVLRREIVDSDLGFALTRLEVSCVRYFGAAASTGPDHVDFRRAQVLNDIESSQIAIALILASDI